MLPTIHCIRHAQGFHNLDGGNYILPDPSVTPEGINQCEAFRKSATIDRSSISLIMASPLSRALHSAYIMFGTVLASGGKCPPQILAIPDAQETSDDPCDIGQDPHLLANSVAERRWPVDLSLVRDGWNIKTLGGRYSPSSSAIEARAKDTRLLIRQKVRELMKNGDKDVHIVLVSHGAFLHFLTNDWEGAETGNGGTGWRNCEMRSYQFEHGLDTDTDQDAMLVETMDSRQKRGKEFPMLGRETQVQLFKTAMEVWGSHGLQRPDQVGWE